GQSATIAWHLAAADFTPAAHGRLLRLSRRALDGQPLEFVFDRPRRPLALGPGLSRTHGAVLAAVGVNLPRLVEQVPAATPDRFLAKLGTLARLARSAGHAKQDFLRRRGRPAVARGFLLDRTRLVVVPPGLGAVVR